MESKLAAQALAHEHRERELRLRLDAEVSDREMQLIDEMKVAHLTLTLDSNPAT